MGEYDVIEHHPRDIPEQYGSSAPTFTIKGKEYPVEKKMQGLAFLLAITIFHETVHYGRNWNNIILYNQKEYGWLFEDMALGIRIDEDTAQNITNYRFKLN